MYFHIDSSLFSLRSPAVQKSFHITVSFKWSQVVQSVKLFDIFVNIIDCVDAIWYFSGTLWICIWVWNFWIAVNCSFRIFSKLDIFTGDTVYAVCCYLTRYEASNKYNTHILWSSKSQNNASLFISIARERGTSVAGPVLEAVSVTWAKILNKDRKKHVCLHIFSG